jgi:hypothetical protein
LTFISKHTCRIFPPTDTFLQSKKGLQKNFGGLPYLCCWPLFCFEVKNLKNTPMKSETSLGIFMDHASANLIAFTVEPIKTETMLSPFTHADKEKALGKNENLMHNKEQHQQLKFFKTLAEHIIKYDDVLLFGPTDAKTELFHFLRADRRFEKKEIDVLPTDKLTENQQHAFVKAHFSKNQPLRQQNNATE